MYVKILKNIAGVALIGVGIVGLFLPVLQGILMIVGGLLLLGVKKEQIKRWLKRLEF